MRNFSDVIKKARNEDFSFLCLDSISAKYINELGFSVSFLEDWASPEERIEIHSNARSYEKIMCEDFFEVSPKINFEIQCDGVMFNCFWYEFALQEFLYKKFIESDVQEIKFFKFSKFGPAVHEAQSDTFGNYWLNQASDKLLINPIKISKENFRIKKILMKIEKLANLIKCNISFWLAPKDKKIILFSCTFQEFYYYKNLIFKLQKSLGKDVVVLLNNINFLEAFKLQIKYNIKIFSFPAYISKNKFSDHIKLKKNLGNNGPFFALKSDTENFEYFQNTRWPSMILHKIKLGQLLKKIDPSLLIYTSLEDYFNQMIGSIASEMNIHSISLPHGILATTRRGISFADDYAVGNKLAKFCAETSGISTTKIRMLKDLDPEHEYPMNHKLKLSRKFNVIALIDPVKSSSETRVYSTPPVGYKDQIKAINDLSELSKMQEINLIIKTHPGWPEHEIVNLSNPSLMNFLCPKNTSLENLLDQADLVIGINYYGAALVSAAKRNLPTILHYVAPIQIFAAFDKTYSRFFHLGEMTFSSSDLLMACKKVINDKIFRENLIQKSSEYRQTYINSSELQSVGEYILSKVK
ncbi:hypothetical protein OAH72_00605 [Gammaproteobacteria bacterium]|nr:hypothetical protein [Gammaproteobacteria bacterium]